MQKTAVTGSPGFISIAVSDVNRSASFYEQHLGAVRDTFDFGADAVAFVGWPTFALSSARRPGPRTALARRGQPRASKPLVTWRERCVSPGGPTL